MRWCGPAPRSRLPVWLVLGDTPCEQGGDTLREDKLGGRSEGSRSLPAILKPAVEGRR